MSLHVTVVVPVRNAAATVGRCLDALAAQVGHGDTDVVIVDNGSTDATRDVVRAHRGDVRLVIEPTVGSYAARNAGVAAARGDLIAFTDADCVPDPGWVAAGARAAEGADLVAGGIRMTRSPHPGVAERYDRAVYLRQQDLVANAGWAVTANLFVRRAVFDAVGGFDPALPSSGDREFCHRATAAGFGLVYAPHAVVGHDPRTRIREIWHVNRRIGRGMALLATRESGRRPWRSPELRQPLSWVVQCVAEDGTPLRRRQLAGVHAVAMAGRWVGLLTAR